MKKGVQAVDYAVMPLEGLWWADDPTVFVSGDRSRWNWTIMIMQSPLVGADVLDAAQVRKNPCGDADGIVCG